MYKLFLPFSLNYLKLQFRRNKIGNPLSHAQDDEKCISRESVCDFLQYFLAFLSQF